MSADRADLIRELEDARAIICRAVRARVRGAETYLKNLDLRLKEADAVEDPAAALLVALNPRAWTADMSDAWHKALPDINAAFAALREAALKASRVRS